jgi:AraC-like DNA-binding protein/ligand-binding sensor protein
MKTPREELINLKMISECVDAYSQSTGLGCAVSNGEGTVVYQCGFCCGNCAACGAADLRKIRYPDVAFGAVCENMCYENAYSYLCPMGFGNISTTISDPSGHVADITAGPFMMSDTDDMLDFGLGETFAPDEAKTELADSFRQVPRISPGRIKSLIRLLSLLTRNIFGETSPAPGGGAETRRAVEPKSMFGLGGERGRDYPINTEKRLLKSIAESDDMRVKKLLNELLGHILLSQEDDVERIKCEIYGLLVVISRGAIDAGVPRDKMLQMNRKFWWQVQPVKSINGLCILLADVVDRYVDGIINYASKKNTDVIYNAVTYINQNYSKKITLEEVAKAVYLSPTYFCKIFKREIGCNFNEYLNQLRIEKSKELLSQQGNRIGDIVATVGFDDHSYFTTVFKRVVGVSPKHFRKSADVA